LVIARDVGFGPRRVRSQRQPRAGAEQRAVALLVVLDDHRLVVDLRRAVTLLFGVPRAREVEAREALVRLRRFSVVAERLRVEVDGLGEDERSLALRFVGEVLERPADALLLDGLPALHVLQSLARLLAETFALGLELEEPFDGLLGARAEHA